MPSTRFDRLPRPVGQIHRQRRAARRNYRAKHKPNPIASVLGCLAVIAVVMGVVMLVVSNVKLTPAAPVKHGVTVAVPYTNDQGQSCVFVHNDTTGYRSDGCK